MNNQNKKQTIRSSLIKQNNVCHYTSNANLTFDHYINTVTPLPGIDRSTRVSVIV